MNAPYGAIVESWVDNLVELHKRKQVTEAIALTASRTDTLWFRKLREALVCFVDHRLKFSGHHDSAPFPSAVFYLGGRRDCFVEIFHQLGRFTESTDARACQ